MKKATVIRRSGDFVTLSFEGRKPRFMVVRLNPLKTPSSMAFDCGAVVRVCDRGFLRGGFYRGLPRRGLSLYSGSVGVGGLKVS